MRLQTRAVCIYPICVAALLCIVPLARAQARETITATATITTKGGVATTAPVIVAIDRFATDPERDEVHAALKAGGTGAVQRLLLVRAPVGTLKVGGTFT